jgi:ATP-dependent 26S proteasome regulatory subunit
VSPSCRAISRKNQLHLVQGISFTEAAEATEGYSAAELEAVMLAAAAFSGDSDTDVVLQEHLDQATKDVISQPGSTYASLYGDARGVRVLC